jgi:hypothetical protein
MTHVTHTTIPSLRPWRRVIAAVVVTTTILAVTTVVQRRDDDTSGTTRTVGHPTTVLTAPGEVSAYARSHGLTGLSPASLAPRGDTAVASPDEVAVYEVYRDVAQYAHTHGLAGLSPASLAPAAGSLNRMEHQAHRGARKVTPASGTVVLANRTDSCAQRLAQAWRGRRHFSDPYNKYLLRQLPGCP